MLHEDLAAGSNVECFKSPCLKEWRIISNFLKIIESHCNIFWKIKESCFHQLISRHTFSVVVDKKIEFGNSFSLMIDMS